MTTFALLGAQSEMPFVEGVLTTPATTTWPVFVDQVAFGSSPLDALQVYTDVTPDVQTRSFRRGRQTEADHASTGVGGIVLVDDARKYDPTYTSSPNYPGVRPMRRMRAFATFDGGTTLLQLHQTFVDIENGWVRDESRPGYAIVQVPGNDAFDLLNVALLPAGTTFPQQLTGERIAAIADAISWPTDMRDIDAGQETMQATTGTEASEQTALSQMQFAETTEPGYLFLDHRGYLCFHDRARRLSAPYTVSQATFCDAANPATGRVEYASLITRRSKVTNDWRVSSPGNTTQVSEDTASIVEFGRRSGAISTAHITNAYAKNAADYALSLTKDSYERYEELTLDLSFPEAWLQAMTRKIADRITVVRTPPGKTAVVTSDWFIEAISFDGGPGPRGSCKWRLGPPPSVAYPPPPPPGIAVTNLTAGHGNGPSKTTASITPVGNALILATIVSTRDISIPGPATISGGGYTWVLVDQQEKQDSTAGSNLWVNVAVYRGLVASPTSGALTITAPTSSPDYGLRWSIDQFENVNTGGTNGSSAVRQVVKGTDSQGGSLTLTLAALLADTSIAFGAFGEEGRYGTGLGAASGFTALAAGTKFSDGNSGVCGLTEYKRNVTSVGVTELGTPSDVAGIAIEVIQ